MDNSQGESLLHVACRAGHLHTMSMLQQEGFDIMAKDRESQTPLHLACRNSAMPLVKFLVDSRASVNVRDDLGETPAHEALKSGSIQLLESLLELRADLSSLTKNGRNMLHLSARFNSVKTMKKLLSLKVCDANQQTADLEETPLHVAAQRGNLNCLRTLAMDPKVDIWAKNVHGDTVMVIAARKDDVDALRIITKTLEAQDESPDFIELQRAFLEAVEFSCIKACRYLVEHCKVRPPACRDEKGNNALHLVARSGNHELATLLLEEFWGAGSLMALHERNREGQLPSNVAEISDYERIRRVFNRHQANRDDRMENYNLIEDERQTTLSWWEQFACGFSRTICSVAPELRAPQIS